MANLILILGGVRSGKSRFAQELAAKIGGDSVLFVATAEAGDAEMTRRIELHRDARPAAWDTLEQPLRVGAALEAAPDRYSAVLVDCLTLLVSNVLLSCEAPAQAESVEAKLNAEIDAILEACQRRTGTVIIVSGEVGLGLVPESPLGRIYRDLLGWANGRIAARSEAAYLMVAGLPVEIKSLATTVERAAACCDATESPGREQAKPVWHDSTRL